MKPRKVYKRAGIIHMCWKGAHYAAPAGVKTVFQAGDLITVSHSLNQDTVLGISAYGDPGLTEEWVRTVIGKDAEKAPEGPAKTQKVGQRRARPVTPETSPVTRKEVGQPGLPTAREVDTMLVEAAPNDVALEVMRVAWVNWHVSDRRLNLMGGMQWTALGDTRKVKALGEKLMGLFR